MRFKPTSRTGLFLLVSGLVLLAFPSHAAKKFFEETFRVGEVVRNYKVFVPSSAPKGKKLPTVIAFHGFESDPDGLRWLTKLDAAAEEHGFLVIYPNAQNKSWNVGKGSGSKNKSTDDLSFSAALLDVIAARHRVDTQRIYTLGFSNGAQMAALMVCRFSQRLAGAAMVAHTMNIPKCNPSHRVPIAIVHGAKDKLSPFRGGGPHDLSSHAQTVEFFKAVNQVQGPARPLVTKKSVTCSAWGQPGQGEVIDCVAKDGGHTWPGGVEFMVELFGAVNRELSASGFLFDFFARLGQKAEARPDRMRIEIADLKGPSASKPAAVSAGPVALPLEHSEFKRGDRVVSYALHKPEMWDPGDIQSAVIAIGPIEEGFQIPEMARVLGAEELARKKQTVYVFPKIKTESHGQPAAEDIDAIVDRTRKDFPRVESVYLFAYSDAGESAEWLHCHRTWKYAAYAFVSYAWRDDTCDPMTLRPVLVVSSKKDPLHPHAGTEEGPSFPETLLWLRENTDELLMGQTLVQQGDHWLKSWSSEDGRYEVVGLMLEWGGNTIPGAKLKFPEKRGIVMNKIDAMDVIVDFFGRHHNDDFTIIRDRASSP